MPAVKCKLHPKYKAKLPPRVSKDLAGCKCWDMWRLSTINENSPISEIKWAWNKELG